MGRLVEGNGARLWVEQRGASPDLVLLCGLGDTHIAWSQQVDSFARRFRVTVIDNRGVGHSSAPDGPFTVAEMAQDAAAVLCALEIEAAHVAGFSMGGAIAQELALAHTELVLSLTLVGTWCRTDPYQRALFESWKRLALTAASDDEFVRSMFLWVYSRRAFKDGSIDAWIAQALAATPAQATDAFLLTIDAIEAHDTADRLGTIAVPTLVIGGDCDLICPADVQADLAARIPQARLELLPGEAHQPFQEAPAEFDRIVLAFLDSAVAGARPAGGER